MVDRTPKSQRFRMPAEWEPHAATWLAWPHNRDDFPGKLSAVRWVFAEIIRTLARHERVRLIVPKVASIAGVKRWLARAGVELEALDFVPLPTDRSWTRDYLPTFVVNKAGRVGAVKWRFTGWQRYADHKLDERAGLSVAQRCGDRCWLPSRPVRESGPKRPERLVLEGGAIDADGEGSVLVSEACLQAGPWSRNPELSRGGAERIFRSYLGVSRVLWVGDGIAGDDTAGHVDDFVRFVGSGRVAIAREANPADQNHAPLAAARERLSGVTDAMGRRLQLIDIPMPAPLYFGGERLPASYLNFYVANQLVLVPTFNDPADRQALGLIAELFPDHEVVGIHSVDLVLGLGAIHCSTQQEPAPGL